MKDLRIGSIKRKERLKIFVDGREVIAYRGETVLSSLIAAGYKSLRESPILNEKRGAFCGMGVCYECHVRINGTPKLRSCMIEVEDNMKIELNG